MRRFEAVRRGQRALQRRFSHGGGRRKRTDTHWRAGARIGRVVGAAAAACVAVAAVTEAVRRRRRRRRERGDPDTAAAADALERAAGDQLMPALEALERAVLGAGDVHEAVTALRSCGAARALVRVALGDGTDAAVAARTAALVDRFAAADVRLYSAVLAEGGLPFVLGFLARYGDVSMRLFQNKPLRMALPEGDAAVPSPAEAPEVLRVAMREQAEAAVVQARRHLADVLLGLPHDEGLGAEALSVSGSVAKVRSAWDRDDQSPEGTTFGSIVGLVAQLRSAPPKGLADLQVVRAAATLSASPDLARDIVDAKGLGMLRTLYEGNRGDERLCVQAARAVANLAIVPGGAEDAVANGFLPTLVGWARGGSSEWTGEHASYFHEHRPPLRLQLQAQRALLNMASAVGAGGGVLMDEVYQLSPRLLDAYTDATDGGAAAPAACSGDVVFVHGMMGHPLGTWRRGDDGSAGGGYAQLPEPDMGELGPAAPYVARDVIWPLDWLGADLPGARVLSLGYRSVLSTWSGETRNLATRAADLEAKLLAAGVGCGRGGRAVFVTHSMGGILMKQTLLNSPELALRAAGAVFYATPHAGSQLPKLARIFYHAYRPTEEVLELGDEQVLRSLNDRFATLALPTLSFAEGKTTALPPSKPNSPVRATIVRPESANPGFGDFVVTEADHLDVCKPCSRADATYARAVEFMSGLLCRGGRGVDAAAATGARRTRPPAPQGPAR